MSKEFVMCVLLELKIETDYEYRYEPIGSAPVLGPVCIKRGLGDLFLGSRVPTTLILTIERVPEGGRACASRPEAIGRAEDASEYPS